ncbi:MAG: riboflavin synthase, partial [Desulfonatronovibrionaceae bacterium]
MFTGLIQTTGRISGLSSAGRETRMRIQPSRKMTGLEHGESIAVNGVCLTVEDFAADWFHVYASSQTMSVTSLGRLKPGDPVNLERALTLKDRLGGHLVSGHVDCLACVAEIEKAGQS